MDFFDTPDNLDERDFQLNLHKQALLDCLDQLNLQHLRKNFADCNNVESITEMITMISKFAYLTNNAKVKDVLYWAGLGF